MCSFYLTQYLFFPFLISQWKMPNLNENISHAHNETACNNAVLGNYLYMFYSLAFPDEECAVIDTAHYLLT
jgi:hypothetical protein